VWPKNNIWYKYVSSKSAEGSADYDLLIGIEMNAFLLCFLLTWSNMLMVFLPVPADFVYSAPTPLLPLSVQYFSAGFVQKIMSLENEFDYSHRTSKADI
jgi:hypothetical protein